MVLKSNKNRLVEMMNKVNKTNINENELGMDQLDGGLADDANVVDFDPQQIAMGISTEMEHTKDPKMALEIAMDHLMEIPDYYTRLEKMESGAEKEDENKSKEDEILGINLKTPNKFEDNE